MSDYNKFTFLNLLFDVNRNEKNGHTRLVGPGLQPRLGIKGSCRQFFSSVQDDAVYVSVSKESLL